MLDFKPVPRRCSRRDGWSAEVQRGFIVALTELGNPAKAAHAVGRTMGGAYKVRTSGGAEGFAAAWDKAVDLYLDRNPKEPLTGRWRPSDAKAAPPPAPGPEPEPEPEPDEDALWHALCDSIFMKYLLKLDAERDARLAGRIVEADLYVRQLTWLEVALDLGGQGPRAIELLNGLKRGERHAGEIVATPVSLVLDQLRRSYWARCDEPERPPLAPLGIHDEEAAAGQPLECRHWPERDGPGFGPSPQSEAHLRRNAEAQRAWEEKARKDAEAWAAREATAQPPDGASGGEEGE